MDEVNWIYSIVLYSLATVVLWTGSLGEIIIIYLAIITAFSSFTLIGFKDIQYLYYSVHW